MRKAFTLLEILVVIGIIGILIGLGAVSYSTAQKKARDAKRKGDLKSIQNVMEQCYTINSFAYPTFAGDPITSPITCGATTLTLPTTDPLGSAYTCVGCTSSSYTICPPVVRTGHLLEADDTCPSAGTACCVNNQQ